MRGDVVAGVIIAFILGCMFALMVLELTEHNSFYRDGQIDCINGAVYYKIAKQMDGTTSWVYSKEIVK